MKILVAMSWFLSGLSLGALLSIADDGISENQGWFIVWSIYLIAGLLAGMIISFYQD